MTDPRDPWTTPSLLVLSVGMDTAMNGGSGADGWDEELPAPPV